MITTVIIASAVVGGIALVIYEHTRTPAQQFARHHRRWLADCHQRGLTPEQQTKEMRFRMAMASLRRRASDAAIADPQGHAEAIVKIAKEEAMTLALLDKDVAKRFLRVVEESELGHILHKDAHKAVVSEARSHARSLASRITDDHLSALR
jgi:hypothetical protein